MEIRIKSLILFCCLFFIYKQAMSDNLVPIATIKTIKDSRIDYLEKLSNERYLLATYESSRNRNTEFILLDNEFNELWRIQTPMRRRQGASYYYLQNSIFHDDNHVYITSRLDLHNINNIRLIKVSNEGKTTEKQINLKLNGRYCGSFLHNGNIYLLQERRGNYELNIINTTTLSTSSRSIDLPELSSGYWSIDHTEDDVMFMHAGGNERSQYNISELIIRLFAIDVQGRTEFDILLKFPLLPGMQTYCHVYHYNVPNSGYRFGPYYRLAYANKGNTIYVMGLRNNGNERTFETDGFFVKKVNLLEDSYEIEWLINEPLQELPSRGAARGIYGDIYTHVDEENDIFIHSFFSVPSFSYSNIHSYFIKNFNNDILFRINSDEGLYESRGSDKSYNNNLKANKNFWTRPFYYFLKRTNDNSPSSPWLIAHSNLLKKHIDRERLPDNVHIGFIMLKDEVIFFEEIQDDNVVNIYKADRRFN